MEFKGLAVLGFPSVIAAVPATVLGIDVFVPKWAPAQKYEVTVVGSTWLAVTLVVAPAERGTTSALADMLAMEALAFVPLDELSQ